MSTPLEVKYKPNSFKFLKTLGIQSKQLPEVMRAPHGIYCALINFSIPTTFIDSNLFYYGMVIQFNGHADPGSRSVRFRFNPVLGNNVVYCDSAIGQVCTLIVAAVEMLIKQSS